MKPSRTVRVGSRSSPLALAQTEEVLSLLRGRCADVVFEVVHLSTRGDRSADAVLTSLGRGAFVKDIELALLDGEIDFAVHSAKDVGPDILRTVNGKVDLAVQEGEFNVLDERPTSQRGQDGIGASVAPCGEMHYLEHHIGASPSEQREHLFGLCQREGTRSRTDADCS